MSFPKSILSPLRHFLPSTSISTTTTLPSQPFLRSLSTTKLNKTATSDWQSTIGGRSGILTSKQNYKEKYLNALKIKADKEGISLKLLLEKRENEEKVLNDTLIRGRVERERERERVKALVEEKEEGEKEVVVEGKEGEVKVKKVSKGRSDSSSPIKPLNSILDLSKASTLTSTNISQLWTTYHQSKGYLSATIPTETYERMIKLGKKFPLFVLPLAREVVGDLPEGLSENNAVEMHLLEWAFLPPPSTSLEPIPSPSTVLFTPLAEYQSRQSYAQPYLILTHYTDLSNSHGVVLMRGEISNNVCLNSTDAQILTVRLQLFYNFNGVTGSGTVREQERWELLKGFHEKPEEFQLDRLVKMAYEI